MLRLLNTSSDLREYYEAFNEFVTHFDKDEHREIMYEMLQSSMISERPFFENRLNRDKAIIFCESFFIALDKTDALTERAKKKNLEQANKIPS